MGHWHLIGRRLGDDAHIGPGSLHAKLLAGAAAIAIAACGGGTSEGGSGGSGGAGAFVGGGGPGGFGAGGGSGGSGGTAALGGTGATGGGWFPCSASDIEPEVLDIVAEEAPCFSGSIGFGHSPPPSVDFHIYPYGGYVPMRLTACTSPPSEGEEALEQAVAAALAGRVECVTGEQLPVFVEIDGGARTDADKMRQAISQACSSVLNFNDFQVVVDAAGKVTAVECDPSLKELEQCVQGALAGLTFPCLSSFNLCSKYMQSD